ncbi:ketopantoate reductase [Mariniphaga anaerophila]|uniref:2-dehydropantoate 2-reductase n=1 Tax=Mariniphaga anaerophila TaxID=1484053 RepID=A0A1M5G9K7_9BACT|nr:2-dehydropantoate 2-reductase [Mariniphaga anaerophila]SHG00447.1 ketopantoate reductase [Mariniphaga anaerophila]
MKIAIIGTGGVGGYFGGKLADAGVDVTFLARGKHLEAMQKNGLFVKSILGDFHLPKVKATDKISEIGTVDLVMIGLKAWQVKDIREQLKFLIHSDTVILPLQNGVVTADELSVSIDKKHIIGGLCRIISKIEAPGVIDHFGVPAPKIIFGELNKTDTERLHHIKTVFDKARIHSEITMDIEAELWRKFIMICVSGLLAVTKTTYGELRELQETRRMMIDLFNEIHLLSQKMNINIEADYVDKTVQLIDKLPYDSTSSLTRDVWEGKPSEIEYQNGTVVKLGEKHSVETPVNKFVYNCILPMEIKARKQ